MKDLDPLVFFYVFQEMLGPLLWLLPLLALLGIAGFVYVLMRDGGLVSRRLVISEVVGFFGGFAALALMAWVTLSGFSDAGGPVDWLLVGVIWGVGVVGGAVLSYAALGLLDRSHAKQEY